MWFHQGRGAQGRRRVPYHPLAYLVKLKFPGSVVEHRRRIRLPQGSFAQCPERAFRQPFPSVVSSQRHHF